MPRKGKRQTIGRGIYRNPVWIDRFGTQHGGTYEIRVVVGGHPYRDTMPADATKAELLRRYDELKAQGRTETPRAKLGTLRADVPRYLKLVAHLASADDRADHLEAWCELYGGVPRHRLTSADVLRARVQWLTIGRPALDADPTRKKRRQKGGLSPKTINHYCDTLRHLYHTIDGKRAATPCDDVDHLPVAKTPIHRIPETLMLEVDRRLQEREQAGILRDAKTRARFRVLVSTGKRPSEVMRAQRQDVNLDLRVWVPRDAKGGFCPGVYLNDDQLAAWRLFDEADAWGPFNHAAFVRSLRAAGWPDDVRLYQARHSTWIAASERGVDLHDIAAGAGHTDPRMTRRMYVPVLNSRLQQMSEKLEGRFSGWPVVPDSIPGNKPLKGKR